MKYKLLSIFDIFSDENNCPQCQYGKYELYDLPILCWNHYNAILDMYLENEWLSIDTPALG